MKYKNLLSHMKMGKAILTFVDIKILKDVDIEKVLVSKKILLTNDKLHDKL